MTDFDHAAIDEILDSRVRLAVVAGVMGIAFFAGASLARLPWLLWVGIAWWVGELALFTLRDRIEALPLAAALMLVLLAGPGYVLWSRRGPAAA